MERFKNAGKAVVSLLLVLVVIVGGALSVSAAGQPLVVAATEAEHSHVGEHPALPMAMGGGISIMTACPQPNCGAPQNTYPPSSVTITLYHDYYIAGYWKYSCTVTLSYLVHEFRCVAGHVASTYNQLIEERHDDCGLGIIHY